MIGASMHSVLALTAALAMAGVTKASASAPRAGAAETAAPRTCPAGLDAIATCSVTRDANGAWVLTAMPRTWNQMLIVHAHGGPRLGTPRADDSDEDLERFAVMVRRGYAWTGSTYRRGGYGVRMAAEDVDLSRSLFWARHGRPRLTILHGQSYGANVAAKLSELRALDADGKPIYDGVLLTNGVLSGGTRAYGFRADLRAVYQYFCGNHPRPDEPPYPIWQGLPRASTLSRTDLEARVNACTGLDLPPARRTVAQQRSLAGITGATRIDEKSLVRHLEWATFTFRDLVHERLGGRNPFDNSSTVYRGSGDDRALNRSVTRFTADPVAVAALRYDSDLSGHVIVPTLVLHWRDDPIVAPNASADYERLVTAQGNAHLLFRLVASRGTHGRLADAEYGASLEALVAWVQTRERPEAPAVKTRCQTLAKNDRGGCSLL